MSTVVSLEFLKAPKLNVRKSSVSSMSDPHKTKISLLISLNLLFHDFSTFRLSDEESA